MKRIVLFALFAAALALSLAAQDVMTAGSSSAPAGAAVRIPIYLRDVSGTPLGVDAGAGKRIQGISLAAKLSPASAPLSFEPSGVLPGPTPLFAQTSPITGGVAYLGAFSETTAPLAFTSNATAPGDRIGTVTLTLPQAAQGTVYTLSFDAKLTVLANQAASVFESQFNRKLKLVSGTVTIGGASTATTVSSSANPTNAGSDVTFTAHVSSATPGTITGTVAFLDGTTTIGYGTLQSGVATLTTSALATGSRSITAVYEGSATYQTSTSPAITQTVNVSLASPANLTATATSTSRVVLTWGSVSGATSYEIRRSFDNSAFVTIAAAGATTYNDDTVVGGKTYVYTVRALGAGGASSPYSPKDAATTVLFADDPIVTGTTRIKLAHLTTLRTAVNAFRISAGLGAMTFTDPSPTTATKVKRTHIDELRTALQTARALLGLPSVAFTDPTIAAGSNMKTAHVQELRYAVQ